MIKSGRTRIATLLLAALLAALSGCQKKEGPVEQAGKKVDQATEKVGQEIEKAGSKIQDAAQGDKK
jgi:predicted small lipoprotein YifL